MVIAWWSGSGKFFIPSLYPSLFINTKEQWVITRREDAAQGPLCFRFWLQIEVCPYSLLDKKNRNYKCMERKNNHRPVQISCLFPVFGNRRDTPLGWCTLVQPVDLVQASATKVKISHSSPKPPPPWPWDQPAVGYPSLIQCPLPYIVKSPSLGLQGAWARGQRSPSPLASLPGLDPGGYWTWNSSHSLWTAGISWAAWGRGWGGGAHVPFGKDPDAGRDWRQEEKGAAEDEMVR